MKLSKRATEITNLQEYKKQKEDEKYEKTKDINAILDSIVFNIRMYKIGHNTINDLLVIIEDAVTSIEESIETT